MLGYPDPNGLPVEGYLFDYHFCTPFVLFVGIFGALLGFPVKELEGVGLGDLEVLVRAPCKRVGGCVGLVNCKL